MSLVWLYCVTSAPVADLKGVEGAAVRALEVAPLVALVSDVPEDEYEQPALDERVRDGDWLTPRATVHQDVNAAVHRANDASLPVPFATIYRSDARVTEMLRERGTELARKLRAVRGRSEWVVAIHRDMVAVAESLARTPVAAAATSSGRGYLEAKKREGERRSELRRLDEAAAADARELFAGVSEREFPEPVADDAAEVIWRATYLIRDRAAVADGVVAFNMRWEPKGYEVRVTGPWPPYRSAA